MTKKNINVLAAIAMIATGAFVAGACTDSDYDFNNIDNTVGIGGELTLPGSSTDTIKLADVLDLDNSDCVKVRDNGDYVFEQTGDEIEVTEIKVDGFTIMEKLTSGQAFVIDLESMAKKNAKAHARTKFSNTQRIRRFVYDGHSDDVVDLTRVSINPASMDLSVHFPQGLSSVMPTIDKLQFFMPEYIVVGSVSGNGNGTLSHSGTVITLTGVNTSRDLSLTVTTDELVFSADNMDNGELTIENGDITLTGDIDMSLEATLDITGTPSQTRFEINNTFNLDTFKPVSAVGKFDPSIDLNSLGNIEINGVPEFLTDGDVRADLDNPQIMVAINNTMNATGLVNGTITATKDGRKTASVTVPQMTIHPATTTNICICRRKTAEIEAEYGSNAYEVPELSTLIETIPDNISFDAEAMADKTKESEFMLDHTYTIAPKYSVEAPIAFAENASIVYKDSIDGWHKDLEDYDLSDDACITVTANIENRVPAYLTLTATPIDENGNDISTDVNVEVSGTVIASPDGEESAYTPLTINITKKTADAMKKIDGLRLTIQGKAKSEDGTDSVTGKTLNSKKHFLIARDVKIKVTGKIIADFN
ncbi:hypothetical protein [Prevotella sp. HCN-7019]|uniref:hypothetical protein n=1 Tax=Prevotella sp. HCN-7019 TaxID=3134668 RepID=UPI0030C439C7